MDDQNLERWYDVISRIAKIENAVEETINISSKVEEIRGSLKLLEDRVGDISKLDAPNLVEGLNTLLETIKIMQSE